MWKQYESSMMQFIMWYVPFMICVQDIRQLNRQWQYYHANNCAFWKFPRNDPSFSVSQKCPNMHLQREISNVTPASKLSGLIAKDFSFKFLKLQEKCSCIPYNLFLFYFLNKYKTILYMPVGHSKGTDITQWKATK